MHMHPRQHSLSASVFFSGLRLLIESPNGDIITGFHTTVCSLQCNCAMCCGHSYVEDINCRSQLSLTELLHLTDTKYFTFSWCMGN